jgi:V8-like Glu-specific endopeptidase
MQVTQYGGEYMVSTEPGQSGSPVFLHDEKTKVLGIHKGGDKRQNINLCTLVTEEMVENIERWSEELELRNVFFRFPKVEEWDK